MVPVPARVALLAPHPGPGPMLMRAIDPSVIGEADPMSCNEWPNLFNPEHGFREPPGSSRYTSGFPAEYRRARVARVERIDALARAAIERQRRARAEAEATGDVRARRRSLVTTPLVVYRTDADPRACDLSLDPLDREYGFVFGRRPDLTTGSSASAGSPRRKPGCRPSSDSRVTRLSRSAGRT